MVYNYNFNSDFYLNLYDKYKEQDNLVKAIEYLNEAIRLDDKESLKVELASIYSDMGQFDMSNDVCYEILQKNPRNKQSLAILSSNFADKKNYRAAYFYFAKYDNSYLEEISDVLAVETEQEYKRIGFKLVWSKGLKDCTKLQEDAEFLITMKDYDQAIKALKKIPSNSKQFIWAQKMLVFCLYMIEDYEYALDIINEILKLKQADISMLAVAYNISVEVNKGEDVHKYINLMLSLKCENFDEILKLCYCLMDAKRYRDVIAHSKKHLIKYPYNDKLMILQASAYYMNEDRRKAKNILRQLINLYGERTYAKYYLDSLNLNESCDGGIAYSVPIARALKNNIVIENCLADSKKFKKEFNNNIKFRNILKWRLDNDSDDEYSKMLVTRIGLIDNQSAGEFLESILVDEGISAETKIITLYYLMQIIKKNKISIVHDNYFRLIKRVDINKTTKYFTEAYCMCSILLAPLLMDYEIKLYNVFRRLSPFVDGMRSPKALAAVILYYCKVNDMNEDENLITGLFGANLKTFKKYIKTIENRQINDNIR